MDHIDAHLATVSQDLKYSPAIRASLALGKAHMNKYYNMTDHSEVYRIAMSEFSLFIILITYNSITTVLHPRHKLQYFHDANWDDEWIATATSIIHDEFVGAYGDLAVDEVDVIATNTMNVRFFLH